MTKPILTREDALEAAAQECHDLAALVADAAVTGIPEQARLRESMEAAFTKAAYCIRALAARIPPQPDDVAGLVERLAQLCMVGDHLSCEAKTTLEAQSARIAALEAQIAAKPLVWWAETEE